MTSGCKMTKETLYNEYNMVLILACLYGQRLGKSLCIEIDQVGRIKNEIIKSNAIMKIVIEMSIKGVKPKQRGYKES